MTVSEDYAAACRRRDELRAALAQMDATHQANRARLRASEARHADAAHRAAREAAEADLAHAEARAAALGAMPSDNVPSTRAHDNYAVGAGYPGGGSVAMDRPLAPEQRMSDAVRGAGLIRDGQESLSLSKTLRGFLLGDWHGADAERRALGEGTTAGGGAFVPTILSTMIIDKARNLARVFEAGARTVPMSSSIVNVPRVESDPVAAWHTESSQISPSDPTFSLVPLKAKTLAALVVLSRELVEDTNVDAELTQILARVIALKVDAACLYGAGTTEPLGVKLTSGINTSSMGTNGAAPTSFDFLVDAVGQLQDANESPTAAILAPRTARELAKLKDSQNRPLTPPPFLDGLPLLTTNQIPTNLTVGTGTTTSDVFVGDWRELIVGMRTELRITTLSERYADLGQIGLLVWLRSDIALARPKAFTVVSGVL